MKQYFILLICIVIHITGCTSTRANPTMIESETIPDTAAVPGSDNQEPLSEEPPKAQHPPVSQLIASMTLEEKVGQLFILQFRKNSAGEPAEQLTDDIVEQIQTLKPGGVILFSENISTLEQTSAFISDMQHVQLQASTHGIPLFIAIDEEGGQVSRLRNSQLDWTPMDSARKIAQIGGAQAVYDANRQTALMLLELGVNMNFAPCADLSNNANNTVIGDRAYSADPFIAGEMVAKGVAGLQEKGVLCVIKHFPGHGQTGGDTHDGKIISNKTKSEVMACEIIPFQMGIDAGCSGVMMSHIIMADMEDKPASLSAQLVDLLRNELEFDGLIITDAFDMRAISNEYDSATAAKLAIEAGVDIILMPDDPSAAIMAVLDAVKSGAIAEAQIDAALMRILEAKREILDFN